MLRYLGTITVPAGTCRNNTNTGVSTLDLGTLTGAHFDTVLRLITPGVAGDLWTISSAGDSPLAGGVTIAVNTTTKAIAVHFEDGVSTIADFEAAVAALTGTSKVFAVDIAGTGATVLAAPGDEFLATNFAGGAAGAFNLTLGMRAVAILPVANVSCEVLVDPSVPSEASTTAATGYLVNAGTRVVLPVGRVSQVEVIALFNAGADTTAQVWATDGPIGA